MMTQEKELQILAYMRKNSRMPLTEISRKINVPVSTIFDKLKEHTNKKTIHKYTIIYDFQQIGYTTKTIVLLKVDKEQKEQIKQYLIKNQNVNNLYKINNGYDFMMECIFRNLEEQEQFIEQLETKYRIKTKETHYVISDIKRESFLSEPDMAECVGRRLCSKS